MNKLNRSLAIIFILAILFSGCAGVNVNPNLDSVMAESSGQVLGFKFAEAHPDQVPVALAVAAKIQDPNVTQESITEAKILLMTQFKNDPLLTLAITNILTAIQITPQNGTTTFNLPLANVAAKGFIEGISLYQQTAVQKVPH